MHRHMFPADRPMTVIAVADVAAPAFGDSDHFDGRTLELAGDALAATEASTAATGYPVRDAEITEAEAAARGPAIASAWRLLPETDGWRGDPAKIREIHPGMRTFDAWLAETDAAQIKSLLDGEPVDAR